MIKPTIPSTLTHRQLGAANNSHKAPESNSKDKSIRTNHHNSKHDRVSIGKASNDLPAVSYGPNAKSTEKTLVEVAQEKDYGRGTAKFDTYLNVYYDGQSADVSNAGIRASSWEDLKAQAAIQDNNFKNDVQTVRNSDSYKKALSDISAGKNVVYGNNDTWMYLAKDEESGLEYMISGKIGSNDAQISMKFTERELSGSNGFQYYSMNIADTTIKGIGVGKESAPDKETSQNIVVEQKGLSDEKFNELLQLIQQNNDDWKQFLNLNGNANNSSSWLVSVLNYMNTDK